MRELAERGYEVVTTPLPSFLRSGGSAFCLTLRLDRRSAAGLAPPSIAPPWRDAARRRCVAGAKSPLTNAATLI